MHIHGPSFCFISITILSITIVIAQAAPRGPIDTLGANDDLKPIGKLAYTIENAPPPQLSSSGIEAVVPSPGRLFLQSNTRQIIAKLF